MPVAARVFLDDQPVATDHSKLADILEEINGHISEDGRMIIEIAVDGQSLTPDGPEDQFEQDMSGHEVRLTSADAVELMYLTMQNLQAALGAARHAQREAASLFQSDRADLAVGNVGHVFDTWAMAHTLISELAQTLDGPLDEPVVGDKSFVDVINGLVDTLELVREQMQNEDWLGLADTLTGELDEAAEDWIALIDVLRERIEVRDEAEDEDE